MDAHPALARLAALCALGISVPAAWAQLAAAHEIAPVAPIAALAPLPAAPPALLSLQTRLSTEPQQPALLNLEQSLWARHGRVSLGLQARMQSARPEPEGLLHAASTKPAPTRLHMGLALDLSPRTRFELSTPLESMPEPGEAQAPRGLQPRPQGLRLALELRPVNPAAQLRSGWRVELDSHSKLTLRPRGGGLALYYHSSF
jgi:hypothetical protein